MPLTPDETYDAAVTPALPGLAASLALLAAALVPLHALTAADRAGTALWIVAAVSALLLGGTAVVLRRRPLPTHLAQPAAAALLLVAAIDGILGLVLTGQPRQSVVVIVTVAACGPVLLSLRWLAGTLYVVWGVWAVTAFLIGPSAQWPVLVLAMAAATGLTVLVNQLRRTDVRRVAEARVLAEAAAVRDHLTGLANRRGLAMVGGQMVEQARRQGDAVHCIFVDIEGLRRVNDSLGHSFGDEVIVAVAEAMRAATRGTDVVARWGGDRFCVVGPGPGMAPLELERRVREGVVVATEVSPEVWPVRVSAGGAMLAPWDSGTLETLLGKADQEMYLRRSLRKETPGLPQRRTVVESPPAGDPGA